MADNDDPQNSGNPDPLDTQTSPQAGADDTNAWYYRPASGLSDWAARLGNSSQGTNAGGTVNGEDLQLSGASSQGAGGAADPLDDPQALLDHYNAQKQAVAQFGQNQPFTLDTTSGNDSAPDFLAQQPLQLQQGV